MSEQQWKLVPVDPTEEMLAEFRKSAKRWFYQAFDCELLEQMQKHKLIAQAEGFSISVMAELELDMEKAFKDILAVAPQPPALGGEPEVIACAVFAKNGNIRCWSSDCTAVGLKASAEEGSPIIELVDRAHVARLQAEVDRQSAERQKYAESTLRACQIIGRLRRLLREARRCVQECAEEGAGGPTRDESKTILSAIDAALAEGKKHE